MGKRICLVGFSEINRAWALEQPDDVELWALNEGHNCTQRLVSRDDLGRDHSIRCPCYNPHKCTCEKHGHEFIERYDRWFQLHPPEWKQEERTKSAAKTGDRIHEKDMSAFGRNERHVKFLRECDKPLFMLHLDNPHGPFPSSVPYPLEAVEERFGVPWANRKYLYATSSPAYMVILALYEHLEQNEKLDEIRIAGIELAVGNEYFWQRACLEYYVGMAQGLGITFTRPPMGGSILAAPRYAIDDPIPLPKDPSFDPLPMYQPTDKDRENHGVALMDVEVAEEEPVHAD